MERTKKARLAAKYTNKTLMEKLIEVLKENGCIPAELDYIQVNSFGEEYELRYYEFENTSTLEFGGSEGIFINFAITGNFDGSGEVKTAQLGTAKTLLESREGMHVMGKLMGDFTYELHHFVNKNLDDFTYTGYNVGTVDKTMYEVPSGKRVPIVAKQILDKHGSVKVVDNATGETWIWSSAEEIPDEL